MNIGLKIGMIGAGNVGGTLGKRWAALGHTVTYGVRNPDASAKTVREAAEASDIIVLATPWGAARDAIQAAGAALDGKVLIDATNPLLPNLAGLEIGATTSAAEHIAQWAPKARVVKAFNSVGANIMANPDFGSGKKVAMFYCGDDALAKAQVKQLAADLGFDALDAGPLTQARVIEPFAMLWISLAYVAGFGRDIGFELLRR